MTLVTTAGCSVRDLGVLEWCLAPCTKACFDCIGDCARGIGSPESPRILNPDHAAWVSFQLGAWRRVRVKQGDLETEYHERLFEVKEGCLILERTINEQSSKLTIEKIPSSTKAHFLGERMDEIKWRNQTVQVNVRRVLRESIEYVEFWYPPVPGGWVRRERKNESATASLAIEEVLDWGGEVIKWKPK